MKIPQKQVLLLAASLSLGQMAFPIGNNMSGEASAIAQQNRKQVTGTVTDSFGPVIGASVVVKGTTMELLPIWTVISHCKFLLALLSLYLM